MHFYNLSRLLAVSLLAQVLIAYFVSPWALLTLGLVSLIYLITTTHTLAIDEPEQTEYSAEPATQLVRIHR
jgi:hypothetical protein